ncbi:Cyclin- protein fam58a [Phytophthora boehmeriae]|uniref:Cyclin- protein fam58a n=1 Tax=Phytophthora boehmeriae TaxID=109152 RepID=A0A8T1X0L0_9STRA|nr:Cyclin- protein fam58a [Phytophthora boehmeriae]
MMSLLRRCTGLIGAVLAFTAHAEAAIQDQATEWPSLRVHLTLKHESTYVYGQSEFSVVANPIVSSNPSTVIYDTFVSFTEGTTKYNYSLVNGIAYSSSVTASNAPLVKCESEGHPPINAFMSALMDATPVSSASTSGLATCTNGELFKISINSVDYFVCYLGSAGFTIYGSEMDIAVEYMKTRADISAPAGVDKLGCVRAVSAQLLLRDETTHDNTTPTKTEVHAEVAFNKPRQVDVDHTSHPYKRQCRFIGRLSAALHASLASQRAACVFLHRFFMRRSLAHYDELKVAAACLLTASKAEDDLQDVTVETLAKNLPGQRVQIAKDIVQLEGEVLLALSFELQVDHAFLYLGEEVGKVAALLPEERRPKLQQVAWSFLNDSAITWAGLSVDDQAMAKAAVYAAGLFPGHMSEKTKTKGGEPWWTVLTTPLETLKDAARHVLVAYMAPFVEASVLPSELVELVTMFQKTEVFENLVRVMASSGSTRCVPWKEDLGVDVDMKFLFQSDVDFPVHGKTFANQATAWIDDCMVDMKDHWQLSPSDRCNVEMPSPLVNRAMEKCARFPITLKRSLSLTDSQTSKRAKLVL